MKKVKRARVNKSLIFPVLGSTLSAGMNAAYGWQWDPWTAGGAGLALGALVMDGVKPVLAPAIARDLCNRALLPALAKLMTLLLLIAVSAGAAFSFVAATIEAKTGPAGQASMRWIDLKNRKAAMSNELAKFTDTSTPAEVEAEIKALRGTVVKTRRGTFTAGYLMACNAAGTKDFGPISQKYCPKLDRLNKKMEKALVRVKILTAIQGIDDEMESTGAPKEVDPGAARAAAMLGIDKDTVRTALLIMIAAGIEIIATFGLMLIKPTTQQQAVGRKPKTVHEWIIIHAGKTGRLEANFREIATGLGISRSTAWRHAKKLIDAGIVNYEGGEFSLA